MKSLYDDNYRHSEDALELNQRTTQAIKGIFKEFVDRGYSPREVSKIMSDAVGFHESTFTLDLQVRSRKEKRKNG